MSNTAKRFRADGTATAPVVRLSWPPPGLGPCPPSKAYLRRRDVASP